MGCKIFKHHLMLILLIQLFLWVKFVNGQFIPGPRTGHTATLIGNKIYFIGGYNFSIPKESDVFYYDGNKLAWVEVNNQVSGQDADMPLQFGHTANIGGPKQDLIFIIGGDRFSTVYQLDTKTNKIITPIILGDSPNRDNLICMSSVIYKGIIYLFGGVEIDEAGKLNLYNNHYIFDTINLNWKVGSFIDAPPPRYKHTATLVDEIIYYIGGIQMINSYASYASMSIIFRYSTISNTWSSKVATGNTPGLRDGHSAVLVEGKIYIFGGAYYGSSPTESIAMLDTNNLEWSIPSFKNPRRPNMPTLPNLVYHTATLVDKRMFVAFGNDTDNKVNGYKGLNTDFYIFDFNNFEWYIATADELTNPSSNIPKLFSSSAGMPSSKLAIIGLSVGIVLSILAVVGILVFVYYRRKKNQSEGDVGYPEDDSNISYDKMSLSQRSTLYSSRPSMQYQFTKQFTPEQRISNNNNLTQPQDNLSQEFFILQIPSDGDRFSNHSSNYYPGIGTDPHSRRSEVSPPPFPSTYPYSQRNEAPLPSPPLTDPHSQRSEVSPPPPPSTYPYSQRNEAPLPSPPSTDPHSQRSEAPLPSPISTDPHSQGSEALLPPPPSTDPHSQNSQGSEAPLPPPPSTDPHSQGNEAPFSPPPLTDPYSQGSEALLSPPPPLQTP
ncbi:galactose oxidase [Rhizophagus irregularis]|uniref:Galactose oxidase n=1 Tax=Rhizophagus irregularis TaxID=588596 RepID=A0A2N0QBY6_9GLOM|nr:galactose oxidase [Rhizophagus irregularis]